MFSIGDFNESINSFTLTFKNPILEDKYMNYRNQLILLCNPSKVIIALSSLLISGIFLYSVYISFEDNSKEMLFYIWLSIFCCNFGWIIDFFVFHRCKCLRNLCGYPIIIMSGISILLSTVLRIPKFCLLPG